MAKRKRRANQPEDGDPLALGNMADWRYRHNNDDYEIARWEKMQSHPVHPSRTIDWDALIKIGAADRYMVWIPDDSPWERMFADLHHEAHRPLTIEFISTFRYSPLPAGGDPDAEHDPEVQFRLFGELYTYTMDEWATTCCWYREDELVQDMYTTGLTKLPDDMLMAWWPTIGGPVYGVDGERYYYFFQNIILIIL